LRAAGRRWAAGIGTPTGNVGAKARAAAELLRELGGQVEVVGERDGGLVLQGASCPLSAGGQSNPGACTAGEAPLSDLPETPVKEACDRTAPRPRCRFLISGARQG